MVMSNERDSKQSYDLQYRVKLLEDTDRQLSEEIRNLQIKLDNSLIVLTNNVSNLTTAIKTLQESQERTTDLHHALIVLQERASTMPEVQRELNRLTIEMATQNVTLKAIRFLSGAIGVSVIGAIVAMVFGGN